MSQERTITLGESEQMYNGWRKFHQDLGIQMGEVEWQFEFIMHNYEYLAAHMIERDLSELNRISRGSAEFLESEPLRNLIRQAL